MSTYAGIVPDLRQILIGVPSIPAERWWEGDDDFAIPTDAPYLREALSPIDSGPGLPGKPSLVREDWLWLIDLFFPRYQQSRTDAESVADDIRVAFFEGRSIGSQAGANGRITRNFRNRLRIDGGWYHVPLEINGFHYRSSY